MIHADLRGKMYFFNSSPDPWGYEATRQYNISMLGGTKYSIRFQWYKTKKITRINQDNLG